MFDELVQFAKQERLDFTDVGGGYFMLRRKKGVGKKMFMAALAGELTFNRNLTADSTDFVVWHRTEEKKNIDGEVVSTVKITVSVFRNERRITDFHFEKKLAMSALGNIVSLY